MDLRLEKKLLIAEDDEDEDDDDDEYEEYSEVDYEAMDVSETVEGTNEEVI